MEIKKIKNVAYVCSERVSKKKSKVYSSHPVIISSSCVQTDDDVKHVEMIMDAQQKNHDTSSPINIKQRKKQKSDVWKLTNEQKSSEFQQNLIIHNEQSFLMDEIIKQVKIKLVSYKTQDLLKCRYDADKFISLDAVLKMLRECGLICRYCRASMYVLHEIAFDSKQWTLDRVDNALGHNVDNVVVSCLECNLKRRLTHQKRFDFGKQILMNGITKVGEV